MDNKDRFQTKAIHVGNKPDKETGAISPPINLTSTFEQESVGNDKGFDYSRGGNPTRKRLEDNLAALEQGTYGLMFASGMAATTALFQTLSSGDHVIIGHNVYGGTYRMSAKVLSNHGIDFEFIDTRSKDLIKSAIKQNTKLIFVETPTNPLLKIADLSKIARLAKANKILTVCDNTFASPFNQQPLNHGFDIVIHSATKYLGGHSDLIAGAMVIGKKDKKLINRMSNIHNSLGPITSAFDSYLLLRSLKTLVVRMERHNKSAMEIAKFLEKRKDIKNVIYPGLKTHPKHKLAARQMNGFGGIVSFEIKGKLSKAKSFLKKTKIFTLAESLGGVESLIEHPGLMTHASLSKERREKLGISDTLIRLSIGLENIEDLKEDITQALK